MSRTGGRRAAVRQQGKRLIVWAVALVVVLATVGLVVVSTPYEATAGSIEAVAADERVTVTEVDGGYRLEPADADPTAGLVFYPGALVDPGAYVGSLAPLAAEANVTVVIPRLPLHLAVLDRAAYERDRENLPAGATVAELPGLNHTQFGSYTGQRDDSPTGTSYGTAHERLNDVAVPWFGNRTGG